MDHPQQDLVLAEEQTQPERAKRQTWLVLLGSAVLQLPIWGFAMTFGIFQEAYSREPHLHNISSGSGAIGMTTNGVMYLLMPILFTALDRGAWSRYRRPVASVGVCLSSLAFLVSSWSTQIWHLLLSQGILAALGNTLIYSPTTLYLDESFPSSAGAIGRRAIAYGAILSSKNIVGSCCPILFSALLTHLSFAWTLRLWSLIVLLTGFFGLSLLRHSHNPSPSPQQSHYHKIPWKFLRHRTVWIYSIANAVFASGYGLPQTYLPSYFHEAFPSSHKLSPSLILTLFNAPGILSCLLFPLLPSSATYISAFGSSVCALLLWGLAPSSRFPAYLVSFSILFGFFAGGYSSTWGGWIHDLEREAETYGEDIDTGMLYGLLNGARGVGYVVSGVAGVELLERDGFGEGLVERWGYGTRYGGVILFTGVSCVVGGWSVFWARGRKGQIV